MKLTSLSSNALHASRLLSAVALLASVLAIALVWRPADEHPAWTSNAPTALSTALLAIAALAISFRRGWAQRVGQAIALLGGAIAVQAGFGGYPGVARGVLAPFMESSGTAGAAVVMLVATAATLVLAPLRGKLPARILTACAAAGLLATCVSFVGLLLDNFTLAALGFQVAPTPMVSIMTGIVLLATLMQRNDVGWMSVLLSPSIAGSSARGIIAWTVLAPLALAALVLAGEREGFYTLHFAFALLVAAVCCALTVLVLWNAARVERAQVRAERARDAMQLAANRLRLAKTATGIQMWEWNPAARQWYSIDGAERLDPSTNEYLEAGLARCQRDGKAEFEFPLRRPGFDERIHEERWMLATCWRELRERESIVVGITVDITERKLAALALETSETRLQLAARALPGFVYDWNRASGKIVRTSGIEQMLGFQVAEISPVSRWWEDLVHPDDQAISGPARVGRAAGPDSSLDSISCEYRVRHRDGRYLWIWDHCMLVRDRSGTVTRVVGSVLDITERKEAESRLTASEHRFKAALLATAGIIWTHSPEGLAVGEQTSWSAFTGQSSDELQGLGWLDAIHPDDVESTRQAWHDAITQGHELTTVHRVRRRDGVYRTFAVRAVPVTAERGDIVEWVGSHTDITEQREAEHGLRESLQRLELALDAASIGMWDWDLDSGVMSWTRQTHRITGIDNADFAGDAGQFFGLLLPRSLDHAAIYRHEMSVPGAVREAEMEIERPDGSRSWIQVRAATMSDVYGRARRIVGTVRDITRRKDLEAERESLLGAERAARAELVAAAQAKDEFLATISHELRTPLNAILGWATLLQRPRVEPATVADGLRVIERNARAQTQLLGDLLDANQLMSGKLSLSFEPMDLNDAVRATLDSMRVTIATRKVNLDVRVADVPLPVMGDSVRLQQVVSNLLSNAIKFTPAGGVVSVVTGSDSESAYCEVRDSGEGISAEFLPHIFEKFRQADTGSARRFAGLGLGLAITRQLVESHGGTICVHSEGKGKGACFRVQVPRLRASETVEELLPARTGPATDKPLAGLRILAVDDEADSRDYLERLLVEQGAQIVSVSSAGEALEALRSDDADFNLLVSDIGMPGSTGYDLIETVRGAMKVDARQLPAVALTAFARREDSLRALDKGFQKHLAKPVQVGRLIGAIRQLTGRQQPRAGQRAAHH